MYNSAALVVEGLWIQSFGPGHYYYYNYDYLALALDVALPQRGTGQLTIKKNRYVHTMILLPQNLEIKEAAHKAERISLALYHPSTPQRLF